MCIHKYKHIVRFIDSHEFNIYDNRGNQVENNTDWSKLNNYPLQCRRDRPSRNNHIIHNHFLNKIIK